MKKIIKIFLFYYCYQFVKISNYFFIQKFFINEFFLLLFFCFSTQEEGYHVPTKPPYPSNEEMRERLKTEAYTFNQAMGEVEEEVSCCVGCAICLFGYR